MALLGSSKLEALVSQMFLRLLILSLVLANSVPVLAQKRIALLIGNEDYKPEIGRLANPLNDIRLVANSLRQIGFAEQDIVLVKNGSRKDILRAVEGHVAKLESAGSDAIGFLYYSGHGIANQTSRKNYLIPVDVKRFDNDVWFDSISLDYIVSKISSRASNAANFVIFDACRNPLRAPTKGGKGFVAVEAKRGLLIAFSTDPGQTASDEGQGGGPYARALANELLKPNVHHLDLFQNVKEAVYQSTKVQVPWERNGLLQRVFLHRREVKADRHERPQHNDATNASSTWKAVSKTDNLLLLLQYIVNQDNPTYRSLALRKIAAIEDRYSRAEANCEVGCASPEIQHCMHRVRSSSGSEISKHVPNPVRRPRILLDVDYGGADMGPEVAQPNASSSKHLVLAFARKLRTVLVGSGRFEVRLSRNSDVKINEDDRRRIIATSGAHLVLRLRVHADRDATIRGARFLTPLPRNPGAQTLKEYAVGSFGINVNSPWFSGRHREAIKHPLVNIGLANLKLKRCRTRLFSRLAIEYLGQSTHMRTIPHLTYETNAYSDWTIPSVIVELGTVSNKRDVARLMSRVWRDKGANSMLSALDQYFYIHAAVNGLRE